MVNRFIGILAFLVLWANASAQLLESSSITPPSPEASSLGMVNDIDVDTYTGKVGISLPLFNVQGTTSALPISLSYHGTGGIKVEEIASRVGLGWSLSAGGTISRTIKGLPDDLLSFGYFDHGEDIVAEATSIVGSELVATYDEIIQNQLDFQPDEYRYSFPGGSSRFMVDQSKNCFPIPYSSVKISLDRETVTGNIIRWNVFDNQGNRYVFGQSLDGSRTAIDTVFLLGNSSGYAAAYPPPLYAFTGWHLVEVIDVNMEKIALFYSNYSSSFCRRTSGHKYTVISTTNVDGPQTNLNSNTQFSSVEYRGTVLSEIVTENQRLVIEVKDSEREDLPISNPNSGGHPTDRAIKYISLLSAAGDTIDKYTFSTSYFNSNSSGFSSPSYCDDGNAKTKRLKLDGLTRGPASSTLPAYTFTYNSPNLPDRWSYDQDHWGYYNNAGNGSLIPQWRLTGQNGSLTIVGNGDRNPDLTSTKAGVLKSIEYPLGGVVEFEYELNTVWGNNESYEFPALDSLYAIVNASDLSGQQNPVNDLFTVDGPLDPLFNQEGLYFKIQTIYNKVSNGPCEMQGISGGQSCATTVTLDNNNILYQDLNFNFVDKYIFLQDGGHDLELFALELNDALDVGMSTRIFGPKKAAIGAQNKEVGGLRIKSISKKENSSSQDFEEITKYYYHDPYLSVGTPLRSSGALVSKPKYQSYMVMNYFSTTEVNNSGAPNYFFTFTDPATGIVTWSQAYIDNPGATDQTNFYKDQYMALSASSMLPLASFDRGHIGYRYVTVEKQEGQGVRLGKEEFMFYDPVDFPDFQASKSGFNLAWPTSLAWKRGLLRRHKVYAIENNTLAIVSSTDNTYEFNSSVNSPNQYSIDGAAVTCLERMTPKGTVQCNTEDCCSVVDFSIYTTLSEWPYLQTSSEKVYNKTDSTKYLETVSTFYHGNPAHGLMTHSERTDGYGNLVKEYVKYTDDFAADTTNIGAGSNEAGKAIRMLLRRKATGVLIEKYQIQEDGSQDYIVGGMINEPNLYRSDSIVGLGNVLLLDPGQAGQSSFTPSDVNGSGNFTYDSNYETEQSVLSYTSKAQPSSWIHSDLPESPQTFIYGKGDIPVASIVNAAEDEVAYTSFEEPGFDGEKSNGNWLLEGAGGGSNSLSRTGNYSKDLNSSRRCSTTVANGKKYRLSFWTQNSESSYVITVNGQSNLHEFVLGQDGENGWKYVEFEIDLSGSSGTNLIVLKGNTGNNYTDELRLYPVDAQMSTVCYDSARRVISQTDPTGRTSTYEYDDLGRLVIVRDESGNIISRQTYNFGNN